MTVYWVDPFLHCSTQGNGTTGTSANGTYANPWGWDDILQSSNRTWAQRTGATFANNDEVRIKGLPFDTLTHSLGSYDVTETTSGNHSQTIAPTSSNTNTNTVTDFFFVKGADIAPWHPDGANTHIHCFAAEAGINTSNPRGWHINNGSISAWTYLTGVSPVEVFCLKPEYVGTYGWTNSNPNGTYYYMPYTGSSSIRIDVSAGWDSETTQDGISVFQGQFTYSSTSWPRIYWDQTTSSNKISYDCDKLYIMNYKIHSSAATYGNYQFFYNGYWYAYGRSRSSDSSNPIKKTYGGIYSGGRFYWGNNYPYSSDYHDYHIDYLNAIYTRMYAPGVNGNDMSWSFLNQTYQNTLYLQESGSLGSYSSSNYGTVTMGTVIHDRYGNSYHSQQTTSGSEGNGCIECQNLDRTRINFEQNAIIAINGRRSTRSWSTSTAYTSNEKLFSHKQAYPGTSNQMVDLYPPANLNTIKRFDATTGVMSNFATGRWDSPLYYSQIEAGRDFEASSQAAYPSHWTDPQFKVASSFAGENVALMGKLTCGGNDYRTTQPTISLAGVTDPAQAPHATLVYLCPSNDYDNHPVAFIPGQSAPGTVINNSSGHFEMLLPGGDQTFYMMFKNTVSYASGDTWYKPVIQGYGQNLSSSCHLTFRYFYLNSSYNHDKQNTDQDVTILTSAGEFMRSSTNKEEQMYEQPIDGSELYVLLKFTYVDSGASYGSQKLFITSANTGNSITQAEYDAL